MTTKRSVTGVRHQPYPGRPTALILSTSRALAGWTVAAFLVPAVGALASVLIPATLATTVDAARAGASGPATARLTALIALDVAALVAATVVTAGYQSRAAAGLRHRMIAHLISVGPVGSERFTGGDAVSRLIADAGAAARLVPVLAAALTQATVGAVAVVALARIDWLMAATFVAGAPLAVVSARSFLARTTALTARYRTLATDIADLLMDATAGLRTIHASGTHDREAVRVLRPLPGLGITGRALWRAQQRISWQMSMLVALLEVAVLATGGLGVVAGRVSPGQMLAAAGYVYLALGLVTQPGMLGAAAAARVGWTRIGAVLALAPPVVTGGIRRRLPADGPPDGGMSVRLTGVRVHAGPTAVLDGVDLDVPGGTSLAVVGASGAGKTTLAWLIGRLRTPDAGRIRLDGIPVDELDGHDLRRAVGYAFERPNLPGDTVHDVIAYGRPDLCRARVERAAELAQADTFIRRLADGYDTSMAQVSLSRGEVQRLGLARLIVREPAVLIIDDATSGLDATTEALVSAAVAAVGAGRTRIIVTHRAVTAARAERVAWLDCGRLRAVGRHVDLLADPDYRALFAVAPL